MPNHIWGKCTDNPCLDHPNYVGKGIKMPNEEFFGKNAKMDWTEMNNEKKQTVWRTMSKSNHSGYFVWDIMQVMGEPDVSLINRNCFLSASDSSYISIQCYHYWTEKEALEHLNDERWELNLIVIKSRLIEVGSKVYRIGNPEEKGTVQKIQPCDAPGCSKMELTLTTEPNKVKFYGHADMYVSTD